MKYDELEIDRQSGVIFKILIHNSVCQNEELAFVLENRQVPRSEMDKEIKHALESVDLKVTDQTYINHLSGGMKQN